MELPLGISQIPTTSMTSFEDNADVFWESDVDAVRVVWKNLFMSIGRFREVCKAAFEELHKNGGEIWIADQRSSQGVFSHEIQQYILNELSVEAREKGVSMVLTVLPKNSGLSKISAKRWSSGIKTQNEFINEQFESLEECKRWIQHVKANP